MDAMFFSHFMVNKKGPLSRVWLAAHWDKKLTKAHIFEISIESSVEGILQPKVKMALRTTGHLLLGVVRIYSRKAKYLLADCNEAFVKIKMAFRPGMVDLPEGNREASLAAITLPEVFHDFENIGEMTIEVDTPNTLNQCRAEEITIKEDYGTLSLMNDDAFGDMAFNDPDIANDATNIDEGFDHTGLVIAADKQQETFEEKDTTDGQTETPMEIDTVENEPAKEKSDLESSDTVGCGLFETGLFDDTPIGPAPLETTQPTVPTEPQPQPNDGEISDDDLYGDFGPASVGLPSGPSSPCSPPPPNLDVDMGGVLTVPEPLPVKEPVVEENQETLVNQTTLIQNDSEAFALAPLDATTYRGMERSRSKRKRKLIVDEVKNISGEEMKNQLSDTRDIITTLDLAPPTKRLMHWKETGGVEKLFALPGHVIHSRTLSRLYLRHLTTRPMDDEPDEEEQLLDLEETTEKPREGERSSKRLRRQEPDPTEVAVPEPAPLEMSESDKLLPDVPTNAETIAPPTLDTTEEIAIRLPQLPDQDADTVIAEDVAAKLAAVPEEVADIEKSVIEPEKTVEETTVEKEVTSNDLFDSLTRNDSTTNTTTTTTTTNTATTPTTTIPTVTSEDAQEPANPEEEEKTEQNNILPLEDDDDNGGPASVGPPEEQLADETYEQFEERVHSKRASLMLHVMKRNLDAGYTIPFSAIVRGNKRKQVAQKFYTCLVLKKQQTIEMEQSAAYEEVYISKGQQYDEMFA